MSNGDTSITSAGTTQTCKRVYCREWRVQHRTIRATVSLPRLQLVNKDRPIFECPICFFTNDKVPICFWCKSSSPGSTAAFWSSMPKQRTISAPMHLIYASATASCAKPTRQPVAVGTGLLAYENRNTDKSSVIYNQPCQKPFVPPSAPPASVPSNPNCSSRVTRAVSGRSALLRRSSYNSTISTVTTCTTTTTSVSPEKTTNPVTTFDSDPLHHLHHRQQRLRLRRVDDDDNANANTSNIGRQRITITASDFPQQQGHQQQQQQSQDDQSCRFRNPSLRRKGHFLRTTAGMIVKKTNLSALFRKDTVPTLEPSSPTLSHSHSHHHIHVHSPQTREKFKVKFRTSEDDDEEDYHYRDARRGHRHSTSKRSSSEKSPTMASLSTVPLVPHTVTFTHTPASPLPRSAESSNPPSPLLPPSPSSSPSSRHNSERDHSSYTIPTPPSFLSPFWYRPDQYGNLPSSPSPTPPPLQSTPRASPVSVSSRQTLVHVHNTNLNKNKNATDWSADGIQSCRPSFQSYTSTSTRSDALPMRVPGAAAVITSGSPRQQGSPASRTWKTKMGGFFKIPINAVSGRYSR